MIASQKALTRESRTIHRIESILDAHKTLAPHCLDLTVSIEGPRIVLRGHLPSVALKQQLVPAIRQAGVLGQVCNCVEVN